MYDNRCGSEAQVLLYCMKNKLLDSVAHNRIVPPRDLGIPETKLLVPPKTKARSPAGVNTD